MPPIPHPRRQEAALLGALFAARGRHITPAELAVASGIAAESLKAALAPYVQAGYPVEFHPQRGIGLGEPPDIWCAEEILGRCPAQENGPAWEPLLLAETASTNDVAREQARRGAREGLVVAAARQTRGRGRLGREWESRAGLGLYVSLLLRPSFPAAEAGRLAILASVAAVDAVEKIAGVRPRIKWPNDLVFDGRKAGGILTEARVDADQIRDLVLGLGLNVNSPAAAWPADLERRAISLSELAGEPIDLHRFTAALIGRVLLAYEAFTEGSHLDRLAELWHRYDVLRDRTVAIVEGGERHVGTVVGIDDGGSLVLRDGRGRSRRFRAGEVTIEKGS